MVTDVLPSRALYDFLVGERETTNSTKQAAETAQASASAATTAAAAASSTAQQSGANDFTVTVSPAALVRLASSLGVLTTDEPAVVTPTGGTGPYTYAWTKAAGDTLTVTSASAASTTFSANPAGGTLSAQYMCTVTDSLAATAAITVGVTIGYIDPGGF